MSSDSSSNGGDPAAALRLPFDVCTVLFDAVPRALTPDAALQLIEAVRCAMLGPGLLTVNLRLDDAASPSPSPPPPPPPPPSMQQTSDAASSNALSAPTIELQRLWSSDRASYPVGGRKRKAMTPWTRGLFERGEVFIGAGSGALAEVFDDHERIAALGLHAVVNVPLLAPHDAALPGRPFATFNVLTQQERWTPQDLWLIRLLASVATPAVARAARAVVHQASLH